jgi:hypothetical protein
VCLVGSGGNSAKDKLIRSINPQYVHVFHSGILLFYDYQYGTGGAWCKISISGDALLMSGKHTTVKYFGDMEGTFRIILINIMKISSHIPKIITMTCGIQIVSARSQTSVCERVHESRKASSRSQGNIFMVGIRSYSKKVRNDTWDDILLCPKIICPSPSPSLLSLRGTCWAPPTLCSGHAVLTQVRSCLPPGAITTYYRERILRHIFVLCLISDPPTNKSEDADWSSTLQSRW